MTEAALLGLLAYVALPWLSGFMTVAALWNRRFHPGLLVKFFMAPGIGYGLSSVFAYIWFSAFQVIRTDFPLEDVAFHGLLIGLCVLYLFTHNPPTATTATSSFAKQMGWAWRLRQLLQQAWHSQQRLTFVLIGLFVLQFFVLAIASINKSMDAPHGEWDAWQTWNYRARVLYRGGNFALNFLPYGHFDYPMLLPLNVIRGWQYMGGETQLVPILLGLTFLFASIGLLFSVIVTFNGIRQAALAGLMLLATGRYLYWGAAQYADVPMAYFVLCVCELLYTLGQQQTLIDPFAAGRALLLGLLLGLCLWTKNEGIFWLLAVLGLLLWHNLRQGGDSNRDLTALPVAHVLLGALPILTVVFSLKMSVSETNDVLAGQSFWATGERVLSLSRYATIYYAGLGALTGYFLWFFAVLVLMSQPRPTLLPNGLTQRHNLGQSRLMTLLIMVLLAYAFTFVITPQPLQWHLETSLDRLLIHLWPAFLFTAFLEC